MHTTHKRISYIRTIRPNERYEIDLMDFATEHEQVEVYIF